jgi:hypothetical protein
MAIGPRSLAAEMAIAQFVYLVAREIHTSAAISVDALTRFE